MMRSPRCRALAAAALLTVVAGCRDGVPPFETPELERDPDAFAVTFGLGQDADPRWSPDGSLLLYHTSSFGTLPAMQGALIEIDGQGGTGAPVFPEVQTLGVKLLATPAYSPDGEHIAYVDLISVDAPTACVRTIPNALPECTPNQPLLDSAVIRVRRVGETRSYLADPLVAVKFAGTDPGFRFSGDGPRFDRLYPFQQAHREEYAMLFRPTWSADGERIAFSDGLSIRVWRVGESAAVTVPGTTDGVSAAWSPDGEWIAFTTLVRADSQTIGCSCGPPATAVLATRTLYTIGARTVVIVRPDGTGRMELGEGEDPAWSPDGQFLYIRRGDQIVRIPVSGAGPAVTIENTTRGRSPAVSPDGRWLAFARRKVLATVDYDIWVVSLAQ